MGIHRWPVNFPHKKPVTRIMSQLDVVIMNNSLMTGWYYNHNRTFTKLNKAVLSLYVIYYIPPNCDWSSIFALLTKQCQTLNYILALSLCHVNHLRPRMQIHFLDSRFIHKNYTVCNMEWYISIYITFWWSYQYPFSYPFIMDILIKAWSRCHKENHKGKKNNSVHAIRDASVFSHKSGIFNSIMLSKCAK